MFYQPQCQPQFRECVVFLLSCLVKTFTKPNECWELRFDHQAATLLRNRAPFADVRVAPDGAPKTTLHAEDWTPSDRLGWARTYAPCMGFMHDVIEATPVGESGMVVLYPPCLEQGGGQPYGEA